MSYDATLSVDGNPKATYRVTLGNALATLPSLGIPVTDGDMNAVAVLISVETQDARICYGNSVGGALGHKLAVGSSDFVKGSFSANDILLGNAASGSNAVVEVSVFF
jgi:hypothetical protein